MIQHFARLIKDSLVYGIPLWINSFIGVLLLPIMTRYLKPAEYGSLDLIFLVMGITQFFILLGIDSAVGYYYNFTEDEDDRKQYISTSLYYILIGSAIFISLLFILQNQLAQFIFQKNSLDLYWLFALIPLTVLDYFFLNLLKWSFRQKKYLVISLGVALSKILLSFLFVVFLEYHLRGVLLAYMLAELFFSFLGFTFTRDFYVLKFDFTRLKALLKYGYPYLFIGLGSLALTSVDRVFLSQMLGLSAVGIYGMGSRIASALSLITGGFCTAWGPLALSLAKKDEGKEYFAQVFLFYLAVIGFIWLGLTIFAKEIVSVIAAREFFEGYKTVPYLAGAIALNGVFYIFSIANSITRNTHFNAIAYFAGFFANIILNYFLIKAMGMVGSALATALASLVCCIVINYFGQKVYYIKFNYYKAGEIVLLLIIFWLACDLLLTHLTLFLSASFKIMALFIYGFLSLRILELNVSNLHSFVFHTLFKKAGQEVSENKIPG